MHALPEVAKWQVRLPTLAGETIWHVCIPQQPPTLELGGAGQRSVEGYVVTAGFASELHLDRFRCVWV